MSKLFKNIFKRNFTTAPTPKLADDLGKFRGEVRWERRDAGTGVVLERSQAQNTLVNLSKTDVIRLISQGQSPWIGAIEPATLKIQRMRFGNHNSGTASKLCYYRLDEPSVRPNIPDPAYGYAGGGSATSITPDPLAAITDTKFNTVGEYAPGPSSTKIITVRVDTMPPSHGTFKVMLYKSAPGGGYVLVETLHFGTDLGGLDTYTRKSGGLLPTLIHTETGQTPVSTPITRNASGDYYPRDYAIPETLTAFFYDYTAGSTGWKLRLEELAPTEMRWNKVTFTWSKGTYNVINSIVPRNGYNNGRGQTALDRFINMTSGDYYPITQAVEYRDADDDYVDDFAVTFAVNMTGQYGNGVTNSSALPAQLIKYTEAFLFDGNDSMFSMVKLQTPFVKNDSYSYYIAWTILAPIN